MFFFPPKKIKANLEFLRKKEVYTEKTVGCGSLPHSKIRRTEREKPTEPMGVQRRVG